MRNKRIKYALVFGSFVSVFLIIGISQAGGPFYETLSQTFCSNLPYQEKTGCTGYLQYRIQRGKSRDEALELCTWACGEVLNDPLKTEDCRKGCRDANALDR